MKYQIRYREEPHHLYVSLMFIMAPGVSFSVETNLSRSVPLKDLGLTIQWLCDTLKSQISDVFFTQDVAKALLREISEKIINMEAAIDDPDLEQLPSIIDRS